MLTVCKYLFIAPSSHSHSYTDSMDIIVDTILCVTSLIVILKCMPLTIDYGSPVKFKSSSTLNKLLNGNYWESNSSNVDTLYVVQCR